MTGLCLLAEEAELEAANPDDVGVEITELLELVGAKSKLPERLDFFRLDLILELMESLVELGLRLPSDELEPIVEAGEATEGAIMVGVFAALDSLPGLRKDIDISSAFGSVFG